MRNVVNQGQYSLIIDIFTCNNCTVKSNEKERLIKKFEWLSEQHCECTPTAALSSSTSEHVDLSPIDEPADDRIITIHVDLSEQEQALLALGPNFALSPKVDERLINQINMEVAACAYRMRWKQHFSTSHSCETLAQHFQRQGAPIHKPYARAPPISNPEN